MSSKEPAPAAAERMRLLVVCARRELSEQQRAALRRMTSDPLLDWHALVREAARHRLLPLVLHHLRASGVTPPAQLTAQLQTTQLNHVRLALAGLGDLLRLLNELRSRGIAAVPYKGPVLAVQLYGSPALRAAGDLDILVRRDRATAARQVMIELGWIPEHQFTYDEADFIIRSRYSEQFHRTGQAPVELHWAFTNQDIGLRLGLAQLEPRLASVRIGGADVPVFGNDDLLIILCVHGAKHRWDRLEWLCGLAEAVRQAPGTDWNALIERASRLGVRRMLLLGLLLAADLLDAPVPPSPLRTARADAAVTRLAAQVPQLLLEPPLGRDAISLPVDQFRYALRERWRDRLRFVLYRITTPSSPAEWRFVSIGGRRIPVHGVTRPLQLLARVPTALRQRHERADGAGQA
jgi:hypothetical protein